MTVEINIPDIGIDEVEVTEIFVKVGDKIEKEQSLLTVEGDKASMEIPSPYEGIVKELKVNIGDRVSTGSLIMIFETSYVSLTNTSQNKNEKKTTFSSMKQFEDKGKSQNDFELEKSEAYVHATPLIRRLAHEFGVDLKRVKGTGRKGRILREDIQNYIKEIMQYEISSPKNIEENSFSSSSQLLYSKSYFEKFGKVEEIELNRIQKASGANLSRNWMMIPHVTHFDKIDITDLEIFRKQQNAEAEKYKLDVKITLVSFIMKAVAIALQIMPRFNSSLSKDNQSLIMKKYINIGVAVDTPNGLLVPIFKNIDKKGIIDLSRELIINSKKAREGKLTAGEMQGGCFTISSIGILGTTYFTPIINAPEVAILGVSKSSMESVWDGKNFMPRLILPVSLSFDHRVIDGADGARFITIINDTLHDIRRMIM